MKEPIIVSALVSIPREKAWSMWTAPEHITRWNAASPDWHTPEASSDLRPGGKFSSRMEARDGSMGFDFWGHFDDVRPPEFLSYTMGDGRKATVEFREKDGATEIIEKFEAESENSRDLQQAGWQAILDNFKKHAEARSREHHLHFEVVISSDPESVQDIMIAPPTYQAWTAEFNPSSRYVGNWAEGSRILFLGEDKDGKSGGMVSRIRKLVPGQFISIEHLGLVQGDQEIMEGPEVDAWAGALENYYFSPAAGGTQLRVTLETNHEFAAYFESTWPKALAKLKAICEA